MASPVKIWRNQKKITRLLGAVGEVISWTIVQVPPKDFKNQAPYQVVLVRLENNRTVIAQLVDNQNETAREGMKVAVVLRRVVESAGDGVIPYGIKVRPI